jgi:hypothetical protein
MSRLRNTILLFVILFSACNGTEKNTLGEPTTYAIAQPAGKTLNLILPEGSRNVLDDFEVASTTWFAGKPPDYSDSTASVVEISTTDQVEGYQSLALSFNFTPPAEGSESLSDLPAQKAIFNKEGLVNLSAARYLTFAISDPERVLDAVSVALSTGGDWYWHESQPVIMDHQGGVNLVLIDLTASNWKTAQTNWEPTAILANTSLVNRISIIIYPRKAGKVYLDYLAIINKDSLTVQADCPDAPVALGSSVFDQNTPLVIVISPGAQAEQFQRLEFRIYTDPARSDLIPVNPFDPALADLVVHYTAPDGSVFSVPAFWMQDYDLQTSLPCSAAGWRARFTPTQPGDWRRSWRSGKPLLQYLGASYRNPLSWMCHLQTAWRKPVSSASIAQIPVILPMIPVKLFSRLV